MFELPYDVRMNVLARHLDELGAVLRHHAVRVSAAVETCGWDGDAARAFRRVAADLIGGLRLASGRLEAAADATRRHGATAQRLEIVHEREAARELRERIDDVREGVERVLETVRGDR